MKRKATAIWKGSGKDGNGVLTTQSSVLNSVKYTYRTRFESDPGTNPEELIAAAHIARIDPDGELMVFESKPQLFDEIIVFRGVRNENMAWGHCLSLSQKMTR